MKRFLILSWFLFISSSVFAVEICPFDVENDPYPGQCNLYVDENHDQVCDLWQSDFWENWTIEWWEEHEEWMWHDCDDVVEWDISGTKLKKLDVAWVAQVYGQDVDDVISVLETEIEINITRDTSVQMLHDKYWLKINTLKIILAEELWTNLPHTEEKGMGWIAWYLKSARFAFIILIGLLTLWLFSVRKYKKTVKYTLNILAYIVLPLASLGWIIYTALFVNSGSEVFLLWRNLGYIAIRLLFFLLAIKSLTMLTIDLKSKFGKFINSYFRFCMLWRRQFGILVFYFATTHALVYFFFWMTKETNFFQFFEIWMFVMWAIALFALLIWWLTSNNFSIKKFAKNRKKIQNIAYIWLVFAIVHIVIINFSTGIFFIVLWIIYFILKVLERKSLRKKVSN